MFNSKYLVTFLSEKWEPIKRVKVKAIPRKDEFVYLNDKYYIASVIVYDLTKNLDIVVVLKEFSNKIVNFSEKT